MSKWLVWSALDWIIAGIGLAALIYGYMNGLIRQLVSLAGLVAAYVAAFFFYKELAMVLPTWIPYPDFADERLVLLSQFVHVDTYFYRALAFALLFFGTRMVLRIGGAVLNIAARLPVISFFNRWGGVLLAGLEAWVLLTVAIHVLYVLPYETPQQLVAESVLAPWFRDSIWGFAGKLLDLWTDIGIREE